MKEGEWHIFTVGNILVVGDSEPKLVLTAANGMKYLIPASPYVGYSLTPGKEIRCKVDKINCSGRIFLEPEHPVYVENVTYSFPFIRKEIRVNLLEEKEYCWVVQDALKQEVYLNIRPEFFGNNPPEYIEAEVVRIKKGKIILRHPYSVGAPDEMKPGNWLEVRVIAEKVKQGQEEFFIVEDTANHKFFLKKKYFEGYGIEVGDGLDCKLVKWNSEGRWVLEPLHPLYREGGIYPFTILKIEEGTDYENELIFYVEDCFHNSIQLNISLLLKEKIQLHQIVNLKVKEMRKGRPVLVWPY